MADFTVKVRFVEWQCWSRWRWRWY